MCLEKLRLFTLMGSKKSTNTLAFYFSIWPVKLGMEDLYSDMHICSKNFLSYLDLKSFFNVSMTKLNKIFLYKEWFFFLPRTLGLFFINPHFGLFTELPIFRGQHYEMIFQASFQTYLSSVSLFFWWLGWWCSTSQAFCRWRFQFYNACLSRQHLCRLLQKL